MAVEDYLKSIYVLAQKGAKVTPVQVAERQSVSSAAVTKMIRKLEELKLVAYSRAEGVRLTDSGEKIALEILRHHRLLELYLKQTLGYPWDRVHDEAETLEHSISEEFEERIDRLLGFPTHDPHGHPIPTKDGRVDQGTRLTLNDLAIGQKAIVRSVCDMEAGMLRHLDELGCYPETSVEMVRRDPYGGSLHVRVAGKPRTMGPELAGRVFISRQDGEQ